MDRGLAILILLAVLYNAGVSPSKLTTVYVMLDTEKSAGEILEFLLSS